MSQMNSRLRTVQIACFPRLHLGLLDLGGATLRSYGGGGLSLNGMPTLIQCARSDVVRIEGLETLDQRGRRSVTRLLEDLAAALPSAFSVRIVSSMPEHCGLGSKTNLLLGIAMAASRATGAGLSKEALQCLSRRGGASGIGVHAFFEGGFLVDMGHQAAPQGDLQPSSARTPGVVPPLSLRLNVSDAWRFHLFLPETDTHLSGADERAFFATNTPLPRMEVLEALAALYHGVVPAFVETDLLLLRSALQALHRCGFKKCEVAHHAPAVPQLMELFLSARNVAVGMSSAGPLVYVVSHEKDEQWKDQLACLPKGTKYLGTFSGRNRGFAVSNIRSENGYHEADSSW